MTSLPRYLFLDIGMVLVSLNYQPLADKMRSLAGVAPDQVRTVLTGHDLASRYETGAITESDFYDEICRRLGIRIDWDEFIEAWYSIFDQQLIPEEMLAALAQSTRLWALSNTNKLHFEFMKRRYTFLNHFEGFVLSHEVGVLKPDARFFRRALEMVQALPSEVLFVDDQEANVGAARSLGIAAFRFEGVDQFAAELKARGLL
jgi:glucose-1-phosphatase